MDDYWPEPDDRHFDCEWCGGEIYISDTYYDIGGAKVCSSCIDDCRRVVEEERFYFEEDDRYDI